MNDWPFPEAFLTLESARKLRCDNFDYANQYGRFVREMQNRVFHFSFRQVR